MATSSSSPAYAAKSFNPASYVPLRELSTLPLSDATVREKNGFYNFNKFPDLCITGKIIFVSERASGSKDFTVTIDAEDAANLNNTITTVIEPLLSSLVPDADAIQLGGSRKTKKQKTAVDIVLPARPDSYRTDGGMLVNIKHTKVSEYFEVKDATGSPTTSDDLLGKGVVSENYVWLSANKSPNGSIYINLYLRQCFGEKPLANEAVVGVDAKVIDLPRTFGGKVLTFL